MLIEVTVCVALHRGDRWLLTVRSPTAWDAPGTIGLVGGRLEQGDTRAGVDVLEAAGRREVAEETGVDLTGVPLTYADSEVFESGAGRPALNVTYLAAVPPSAVPARTAPAEHTEVGWWSLAELTADPRCPPWTLRLVRRAAAVRDAAPTAGGVRPG